MKGQNICRLTPPNVIFPRDLGCPSDAPEERTWAHCPSDLKIAEVVSEVKQAFTKFDARYFLANINGVHCRFLVKSHSTPPPRLLDTSEQLPIEAYLGLACNGLNAVTKKLIDEPAFCNGTVPANDNFPPSEAEAA